MLSLTAALTLTGVYDRSTVLERAVSNVAVNLSRGFADGSGAGQAAVLFSGRRTLADGASESLDLNGTTLTDVFGQPLGLTKIKGLIIQALDSNTTNLTVGNVSNGLATILGAATQSFTLQPGELFAKLTNSAAGYAVTASTGDLLKIANAAGAAAGYDIIIIGS